MKYTKEQLNQRMAEVMGWKFTYKDMDNGFLYNSWCDGSIAVMPAGDWQPTEDANQALKVLWEWLKSGKRTYEMSKYSETDIRIILQQEKNGFYPVVTLVEAPLETSVAICLAIVSAEDGQQATLEEV